ncbi:hypothetical protein [Brachybacterium kimchii]|uniref:Uncharacterized protein n=1 Tax=Brachybacterium kimchii TaxID=2942909 RepID=A0ABY4N4G8_9MICO|nr:hypothetical protein [Brachybacterium kimchii]UQN29457.1 hypothetical protein M4486_17760 [Brachybacterium kimchii]
MSAPRCGYCGAPTMNGTLCLKGKNGDPRCWPRLLDLLGRCDGLEADLESAIGKRGRYGEQVRGTTAPGLPINPAAVEVRGELYTALADALRGLGTPRLPVTIDGTARALLDTQDALRRSYRAPVLLGDLEALVHRAVAITDIPKGTPGVRAMICPACHRRQFLRSVGGTLECTRCGERSTVEAVRHAS